MRREMSVPDGMKFDLDALELLVRSDETAREFAASERLDVLVSFVRLRLNRRLDFVPLVEKALKRARDSFLVLLRTLRRRTTTPPPPPSIYDADVDVDDLRKDVNAYLIAFRSLRDACLCAPDATHRRTRSSLRILLSIDRFFRDFPFERVLPAWTVREAEALFRLLLLDTYPSNKEMAFRLIRSMDPVLLRLDDEKNVCDVVAVAVELGNSVRPVDAVAAAYLFRIALLSPVLRNVLRDRFAASIPPDRRPDPDDEVAEPAILKLILILLRELKKSLPLARENVPATLADRSLYGYVFCVATLLRECDLRTAAKQPVWRNTVSDLVEACFEFSRNVSSVVNHSSPEGYLPTTTTTTTTTTDWNREDSTPPPPPPAPSRVVLLRSWRTVKEIGLLLAFLAAETPPDVAANLLNENQVVAIGEHLVTLLVETKHRGAFEQAHVAFERLCTRLWRSEEKTLFRRLPELWLRRILMAITGLDSSSSPESVRLRLCATRRSAGVPFMIQALLTSEPRRYKDTKTTVFRSTMNVLLQFTRLRCVDEFRENLRRLTNIVSVSFSERDRDTAVDRSLFVRANGETHDPCVNEDGAVAAAAAAAERLAEIRIHALNILTALFRRSRLARVVDDYVTDGLIAAFESYDASMWAERNAASLLFGALVVRIFGVQRTKDRVRLTTNNKIRYGAFFEKRPRLLAFVFEELRTFATTDDATGTVLVVKSNVQPILVLLSRLYRCRGDDDSADVEWKIDDLVALIRRCAKSAIYETRKLAARVLAALLTEESAPKMLTGLVRDVIAAEKYRPSSLDFVHGTMLQILEILNRFRSCCVAVDWDGFLEGTTWILKHLERGNYCCPASCPPCFLLATVYINICDTVRDANRMYVRCAKRRDPLLRMLVSHLTRREYLKRGPALEDYRVAVFRFLRSVTRKEPTLLPFSAVCLDGDGGFVGPETPVCVWYALTDIINETRDDGASALLSEYAVDVIYDAIRNVRKYDPESIDAMFNFLHDRLTSFRPSEWNSARKVEICKFVLNDLTDLERIDDTYRERDSYLRLLGKSYVTLAASFADDRVTAAEEEIDPKDVDYVYDCFCDNFWIASLNTDFRTSVFRVMRDLFSICCYKRDKLRFLPAMRWWTTVLQLLLDNDPEVRCDAVTLIEHLPIPSLQPSSPSSSSSSSCTSTETLSYLNSFLTKFYEYNNLCDEDPAFVCVVLFYWSVSLQENMVCDATDETTTDVFEESKNYDFFEPIEVSKSLATFLTERIAESFVVDDALSDDVVDWINARLNVRFRKRISFRALVNDYGSYVPALDRHRLRNILNPTYKDKLLRVLAYEGFENVLLRWCD